MKSTGVTRPIDNLGRVVIPKSLRKTMQLDIGDRMEFYVEGERIIITKYQKGCHCCGNDEVAIELYGVGLCEQCLNDFNEARKIVNKLR